MKYLIFCISLCCALYFFHHKKNLKRPKRLFMAADTIALEKRKLVGESFQSSERVFINESTYTVKHNY